MKYPYFRGLEADRYSFYRVPKALIKVDLFEKMSCDAKLLYAVLLDRMNLSLKNGWQDENGNAYIICTIDEIMDSIRCARQKAVKLLDELEHEYQLIERRRQGLGKPNLLYVKDLYYQCSGSKQNKGSCTSHNLRDEKLYNIVRNALQMQIQIVMEEAEFVESIRQAQQEPYRVRRIERQIRQLTAEKTHTQGIKEKLYGDYADEILTREDFLNYNELYSKRIEEYDRKIEELEAEQQNLQTAPNAYPFLDVYRKYRKLEEITRPMIVELIEKIEVYEGNRVEITFRFQDEIADLLEELHQKQHEVSA